MSQLLQFFILLPLLGFLAVQLVSRKQERLLSGIVLAIVGLQLLGTLVFITGWLFQQSPTLDVKQMVLYKSPGFEFFIDFYFDVTTAVFALVGALLTFLVAVFSRFYLHREEGFKRFFSALLLFFIGYNLVIFSGNFETFFVGWELLGITSFLLIAFYRDRYLPVKNGFKVLSFYRLGDICLVLAMWMSHHLWHKNITFAEMGQAALAKGHFEQHAMPAMFIALMIVLAAAIKSAQLPFSTWLPRAMEGPTTSSAIFYGSLSVHIGAFLLIRTYPFWESAGLIQGLIIAIGLITSLVATSIARVQSSVKTQIAYASIAQIGLMFIEIALGWHVLALVHFAGNAFLRTYQLLVSPSVLSYLVHNMFFNFKPRAASAPDSLGNRIKMAVYVLSVKEWNFDYLLHRYLWRPFKWVGHLSGEVGRRGVILAGLLLLAVGGAGWLMSDIADFPGYRQLPLVFSGAALLLILQAFTERADARRAWWMALLSQFLMVLAIAWNKDLPGQQILLYLAGSMAAGIVGYLCLHRLRATEGDLALDQYHGHSYEQPGLTLVFLMACLAMAGFPITPTFIGIDLLFTHISAEQLALVLLTALNFLFIELTLLRIYTRIFLGQHKKAYHPIAFRSS